MLKRPKKEDRQQPPERRGWSARVRFSPAGGGVAFRPDELVAVGDGALDVARERFGDVEELEPVGRFRHLRLPAGADVIAAVEDLRAAGVVAQPNHVFFANGGGCGCGCPPHPATLCGPQARPAHASPVYASPVYASPVYASPVYASPVYASPVYASPVYASPVYASPVYASDLQPTGLRRSSARPATLAAAAQARALLAAASGGGPRVAVLDTGVAIAGMRPAELGAWAQGDDDEPDLDPADGHLDPAAGHGTFVGGLVAQVAPTADVTLPKVLQGLGDGDEVSIARTVEALAGKADVLNLSFSGYALDRPEVLASAIRTVQLAGAVVVASAGNDGTCRPTYPAALHDVVSVGAVAPSGPAPFTNHGPWVRCCAPGVDLVSSFFSGFAGASVAPAGGEDPDDFAGWCRWSGTSFSAPLVAGALARELAAGATAAEAVHRVVDAPHLLRLPGLGTVVNV